MALGEDIGLLVGWFLDEKVEEEHSEWVTGTLNRRYGVESEAEL